MMVEWIEVGVERSIVAV